MFKSKYNSLIDLVQTRAAESPDKIAFTFLLDGENQEQSLTFQALKHKARSVAAVLQNAGMENKPVILIYPPGIDYIIGFFGCIMAGTIAVPTYPLFAMRLELAIERLKHIINSSKSTTILTSSSFLKLIETIPEFSKMQCICTDTVEPGIENCWRETEINKDTFAFIQYTSGTTGNPKGVALSHNNILSNAQIINLSFKANSDTVGVSWLPPYHDMGLIGHITQSLFLGSHSILFSPLHFLEKPYRWLKAITKYKVSISGGPNFGYELCLNKISDAERDTLDLSSWEVAYNGAEPIRLSTIEKFTDFFSPCGFKKNAFLPCYGLAEATLFVSGTPRKELPKYLTISETSFQKDKIKQKKKGVTKTIISCGKIWKGLNVIVVNPKTNKQCNPDEIGEIWVSGLSVTKKYWNNPDETKKMFDSLCGKNGNLFLRTGD